MKISNVSNINKFFEVVDKCENKVELVTGNGDRFNLKSKLSQYVAYANIFENVGIKEAEIITHTPGDTQKMIAFMMNCH